MLYIKRFINELMSSNCYLLWDSDSKHCIIIDPASRYSVKELDYIKQYKLELDYIILTHEHTDHTWGVNELIHTLKDVKIITSGACKAALSNVGNHYFTFYFDDPNYKYCVERVDFTTEQLHYKLDWYNYTFTFIPASGHSIGSICIKVGSMLFSGDTLTSFKPYINKRDGSLIEYKKTLSNLLKLLDSQIQIYPGHGDTLSLEEWKRLEYAKSLI